MSRERKKSRSALAGRLAARFSRRMASADGDDPDDHRGHDAARRNVGGKSRSSSCRRYRKPVPDGAPSGRFQTARAMRGCGRVATAWNGTRTGRLGRASTNAASDALDAPRRNNEATAGRRCVRTCAQWPQEKSSYAKNHQSSRMITNDYTWVSSLGLHYLFEQYNRTSRYYDIFVIPLCHH